MLYLSDTDPYEHIYLENGRLKLYEKVEQNTVVWIEVATSEEEKVLANRKVVTQNLRWQWWTWIFSSKPFYPTL
ncbi:hypothetical protein BKA91DRAFT_149136 [Yarrowia lipolytica]|nr:hypothetical protein BKA91DRAFT_149136 [Yarrowia lipolytica]KAE8169044.1 hypothetical protein BKA90DRAFT_149756 [Yarrowia lipolytica]RMI95102.1 hypothetical protein BD777DRAFT_160947 [Yarrowia lipolytica]